MLKMARKASYSVRTVKGVTQYCREEASLGIRFTTKNCISEESLKVIVEKQSKTRESMRRPAVCVGGGSCNGHL